MNVREVEHVESCLICGYDLRGLPDCHKCPECGLPFARDAIILRAGPQDSVLVAALGEILIYAIVGIAALFFWNWILAASAVGVLLLASVWFALRPRRPADPKLLLGDDGFTILGPLKTWRHFDWPSVRSARVSRFKGRVHLFDAAGQEIAAIPFADIGSWSNAQRLLAEIKSRAMRSR
jgi:hypothetical protein